MALRSLEPTRETLMVFFCLEAVWKTSRKWCSRRFYTVRPHSRLTRKGSDLMDQPRGTGTRKEKDYIVCLSRANVESGRAIRPCAVRTTRFVARTRSADPTMVSFTNSYVRRLITTFPILTKRVRKYTDHTYKQTRAGWESRNGPMYH